MQEEGTKVIEVIIPAGEGNKYSFVVFLLAIIFFGGPFLVMQGGISIFFAFRDFLTQYQLLIPVLFGGIVMHEFLHAITWWFFCRHGFASIDFGMKWKHLAPYVHCREPLPVNGYAWGVAMPGIILGILPCIFALIFSSGWWLWFGIFFTAGAAGDILSLYALIPYRNARLIQDHPDEIGFIVHK